MSLLKVAVAATSLLRGASGMDFELVYVGSGRCDGDDTGCVNDFPGQEVVRALQVFPWGGLNAWPERALHQDGVPAWLTSSSMTRCMFITDPDTNMVTGYKYADDGALKAGRGSQSGGVNPVFSSVSLDGRFLLVANYDGPDNRKGNTGASVASLSIADDCSLKLVDVKNHTGHSVNPERQGAAHVHSVYHMRDGFVWACDLGLDRVFSYLLTPSGRFVDVFQVKAPPGSGPRHIAADPNFAVFYVVTEMGCSVLTLQRGGGAAAETSLLANGTSSEGSKSAELAITPDGSTLYATTRGKQNTVTVLRIVPSGNGKGTVLVPLQQLEAPRFPRGMILAHGGKVLLVAGQSKTELWSYLVAPDGRLTRTTYSLDRAGGLPPNPATLAVVEPLSSRATVLLM